MIKRLTIIGASLVFLGAAYIGATGAFFSDAQTSTRNTFTAGAISLKVDDTQHYNNAICTLLTPGVESTNSSSTLVTAGDFWVVTNPQRDQYPVAGSPCNGTWTSTTLGPTTQFFNFSDIKPADTGEDTISMDLTNSNPAWACADITLTKNQMSTTDTTPGELANDIQVFIWNDNGAAGGVTPGNNAYDSAGGDTALTPTPVSLATLLGGSTPNSMASIPLADSNVADNGGQPLAGGSSSHIGFAWCLGTLTVPSTSGGAFGCDGSAVGNSAQNNTLMADITLQLEQSRNQPTFMCSNTVTAGAKVGSNFAHYIPPTGQECNVNVPSVDITTIQEGVDAASADQTVCVAPGTYPETVNLNKGITLASTGGPAETTINGGVNLTSGSSAIEGFTIIPGSIGTSTDSIFMAGGLSSVNIASNDLNGTTVAVVGSRGIETTSGGSYPSGIVITNNEIHGFTTGIYTNPHTGDPFSITDNDIHDNTSGIGGVTNATVENNEFIDTTAGGEAMGADTTYNGPSTTITMNNFLNGSKINTYGGVTNVSAPNNFFNLGGATQEAGESVIFTPETASQYAHN